MTRAHIGLRAESNPLEERIALTPNVARKLLQAGFKITVAIESLVAGELAIGISPAPHDEKIVTKWLNELDKMNEKVFRHRLV